ncbi:MAG: PD-(D/E)XK nuclease family protein, partial [Thermoanaerobaculia bacterium]|nr:PD-(D/E)XK nuclease family protein [Thermoanaerobaculia bacterium]
GGGAAAASSRPVALAVGEAFHRLFETWDHDDDPRAQLAAQRRRLEAALDSSLPPAFQADGRERADALFARLERGELLARFRSLGPHVLARELPVVMPPAATPLDGRGHPEPVGAWTGAIDLLVRDPESGRPLVIDFKTDRVEGEEALAERVASYAPQAAVYREAVRQAAALTGMPAFEYWFLWADRAWPLPG